MSETAPQEAKVATGNVRHRGRRKITVLIPAYNEAANLELLIGELHRLRDVLMASGQTAYAYNWEFLVVDDGSSDNTPEVLRRLRAEDNSLHYLRLSRNFGKEAALLAGLSFSSADETLLYAQQVKDAVITSVGSGSRIGYLARLDGRVTLVQKEAVDMTVHGAGDVFTSALSGELLSGQAPQTALLRAADFCDSCIHETAKRQPGHWYGLAFEPVLKGNRV